MHLNALRGRTPLELPSNQAYLRGAREQHTGQHAGSSAGWPRPPAGAQLTCPAIPQPRALQIYLRTRPPWPFCRWENRVPGRETDSPKVKRSACDRVPGNRGGPAPWPTPFVLIPLATQREAVRTDQVHSRPKTNDGQLKVKTSNLCVMARKQCITDAFNLESRSLKAGTSSSCSAIHPHGLPCGEGEKGSSLPPAHSHVYTHTHTQSSTLSLSSAAGLRAFSFPTACGHALIPHTGQGSERELDSLG